MNTKEKTILTLILLGAGLIIMGLTILLQWLTPESMNSTIDGLGWLLVGAVPIAIGGIWIKKDKVLDPTSSKGIK